MKKKIIAILTTIAMAVTFIPTFAFAEEDVDIQDETEIVLEEAEDVADFIEDAVGTDDVIDDIEEEGDFIVKGEDCEIVMPKDGDGDVIIGSEDEEIQMELPEEFVGMDGELVGNGTVVYNGNNSDVSFAVQGIQKMEDGFCTDGVRSLITIENVDAPHNYNFEFGLPEGYRLISSEEDGNIYVEKEEADAITNEKYTQVIATINPAWAIDANGNNVETYYTVKNNCLTQTVNFSEETAFPVIADSTTESTIMSAQGQVQYKVKNVKRKSHCYGSSYLKQKGDPDSVLGLEVAKTKSYSVTVSAQYGCPFNTIAVATVGTAASKTLTYKGEWTVPKKVNGKKVKWGHVEFKPEYKVYSYDVYSRCAGYTNWKKKGSGTAKRAFQPYFHHWCTYK